MDRRRPCSPPSATGKGRLPTRISLSAGLFLVGFAFCPSLLQADCIDYGAYLHWVGQADTPGISIGVATAGSYAYVADGWSGLQVIDVSDPASPSIVGTLDTPDFARDLVVAGSYAYIADNHTGLLIVDISNPTAPQLVGTYDLFDSWDVAVQGSYAFVIDTIGLYVFDVSMPGSPQLVHRLADVQGGLRIDIEGFFAYVIAYDQLYVIDISDPTSPEIAGSVASPYPLDVAVQGSYAYLAQQQFGFCVVDVSNAASPMIVATIDTPGNASYGVAVAGPFAYVADGASGLQVVDVSVPTAPLIRGGANTPGTARRVAVAGSYAYVTDNCNGLQIIDIGEPDAVPVATFDTEGTARDIAVNETFAFVSGNPWGMRVLDVSDPTAPQPTATMDTPGEPHGITVAGSHAYLAAGTAGLQIIDVSDPHMPSIVGSQSVPYRAYDVAVSDSYAYIAAGEAGLQVIDISDPASPLLVSSVDTPGIARVVVLTGTHAYVADFYGLLGPQNGLRVIDISDPETPNMVGQVSTQDDFCLGLAVAEPYAYLAYQSRGIQVIDISAPSAPVVAVEVPSPGIIHGLAATASQLYAAMNPAGGGDDYTWQVYDLTSPALPRLIGGADLQPGASSDPFGIAVTASTAFLVRSAALLFALPAQCSQDPIAVVSATTDANLYQNGVGVVEIALITRRNSGDAGPVLLSLDLQPNLGPRFHVGEDQFMLGDPGNYHLSQFTWPVPENSFAWEFEGQVTVTENGFSSIRFIRGWFQTNPVDLIVVQQHQQQVLDCWTPQEECRAQLASAIPIAGTGFSLGLATNEFCKTAALQAQGQDGEAAMTFIAGMEVLKEDLLWQAAGMIPGAGQVVEAAHIFHTVGEYARDCMHGKLANFLSWIPSSGGVPQGAVVDSLSVWMATGIDSSGADLADVLLVEGQAYIRIDADGSFTTEDSTGHVTAMVDVIGSIAVIAATAANVHQFHAPDGANPHSNATFSGVSFIDQELNVGVLHQLVNGSRLLVRYPPFTVIAGARFAIDVADTLESFPVLVDDDGDGTPDRTIFPGAAGIRDSDDDAVLLSSLIALDPPRPNPFNATTTIRFSLATPGPTLLSIYDPSGRLVARPVRAVLAAGSHSSLWDGRGGGGALLPSGVYFVRLESNAASITRRLVLLK